MAVTISGMFGSGHTYFSDSPVIITISGLQWPGSSPFNIVCVYVLYGSDVVGVFKADTGGQSTISFDISSALRAIWSDYDFSSDVACANAAIGTSGSQQMSRNYRSYSLNVKTEYMASDDGGVFTVTDSGTFDGGRCVMGRLNEWERSLIARKEDADASSLEHTNIRNGDASTKPANIPERVGKYSITSWVDVNVSGTKSYYYPAGTTAAEDTHDAHAPIVLRDTGHEYVDFLFVNRRGAVETCSALMKESMNIEVSTTQYNRVERPSFKPSRSLMAIASGGRRSWSMSSGYVDREWAEWWTLEFLMSRQWWMRYGGKFVPVTVSPKTKSTSIYDRSKLTVPHVDFTVTLGLEG